MHEKRAGKTVLFCFGLLLLLGIDQFTKYLVTVYLKDTSGIALIPDVFELQYLENKGAAFGILQKQRLFLLLLSVLILLIIFFFYSRIPAERRFLPLRIVAVILVSGASGNMIDRILNGYVIDFLYFKLIHFPIFNVADCYVVISVIIAFFLVCFYYKEDDFTFFKKENSDEDGMEDSE